MTRNSRRRNDAANNDGIAVDAKVIVLLPTPTHAKATVKALIPDNVNMPAGLTVDIYSRGRSVWVRVEGKSSISIASVASTLDEILEHISVARKVMITEDA